MRRRAAASVALVIVVAAITGVGAQGPPPPPPPPPPPSAGAPATAGTSAISGVVVDGSTNQPIASVVVFLGPVGHGPPDQPVRQITDTKGRFVFTRLPAFDGYSISTSKFGYFDGRLGRTGPGQTGARIVLTDGQWLRDVRIVMNRPAAISGTVVDDRGDPIVGAYVRALYQVTVAGQPQLATSSVATTDDRGVYRIGNLTPGKYSVQMPSVQNAVPASTSAATLAGMTPKDFATAETAGRQVALTDPIVDADALNQLIVGRYPIPPRSPDGRVTVYPPTFYPDVMSFANATAVAVTAGQERTGIDLHITPVAAARISGVVEGSDGSSLVGVTLRLMLAGAEDLGDGGEVATALVGDDNRFTFVNVPAGAYVIDSRLSYGEYQGGSTITGLRGLPRAPATVMSGSGLLGVVSTSEGPGVSMSYRIALASARYWVRQPIRTDGREVTNVVVTMKKTSTISGRYVFDMTGAPPSREIITAIGLLNAQPARGTPALGMPRARSDPASPEAFKIEGLLPGEYVLTEILSTIKSVQCGGTDYTDRVFDTTTGTDFTDCVVTLTDKTAGISGAVRDDRGQIPGDAAVLIFPVEPARWEAYGLTPARLRGLPMATSGAYRYLTMPAGDYFLIAVPGESINGWQDPGFLRKAAAQATRVHLEWGQKVTQDLVVKVIK